MRDNDWLASRLNQIWEMLFPEVERKNTVIVRFKGRWKNKFGHIKRIKGGDTEIAINRLFASEIVPEYIIDVTLAHELVHYSHGFQSPLPRLYRHPHKGGIVRHELLKKGFGHMVRLEKDFVKNKWEGIYSQLHPEKKAVRQPREISIFRLLSRW